jgi:hypothetical protein
MINSSSMVEMLILQVITFTGHFFSAAEIQNNNKYTVSIKTSLFTVIIPKENYICIYIYTHIQARTCIRKHSV